jgi:hypothetical protein
MEELIRRIAERFPGKSSIIKTLSGTNARFKDLITDHFTVSEELASAVAANPACAWRIPIYCSGVDSSKPRLPQISWVFWVSLAKQFIRPGQVLR